LNIELNDGPSICHPDESRDLSDQADSGFRRNDGRVGNCTFAVTQNDLLKGTPPRVDIILVGDLFYEKSIAEKVFEWLTAANANGTHVLIGDPGRSYLPKDKLVKLAEYNVPVTRDLEDAEIKRTAVWALS
jgi:predicted nicotinamide N-methyase